MGWSADVRSAAAAYAVGELLAQLRRKIFAVRRWVASCGTDAARSGGR